MPRIEVGGSLRDPRDMRRVANRKWRAYDVGPRRKDNVSIRMHTITLFV